MSYIHLEGITKKYGQHDNLRYALRNVTFHVEKGEIVAIMGPSGSGKSTLLNIIGCLDRPDEGKLTLASLPLQNMTATELATVRSQQLGFVFQNFALLKEYTALENVELALYYQRKSSRESRRLAREALERVGLSDHAHKRPNQLSGGQQQRVAIARAIAGEPPILLADEPTGALDQKTGAEIISIFQELRDLGKTILLVTHDAQIAAVADRIIMIEDGQITNRFME